MAYIPAVTAEEFRPHVKRFYDFLQLWFAVGVLLVIVSVAIPALLNNKWLWAAGIYFVSGATIERLMFDIKRHANPHNRMISHEALQSHALALQVEKWFANFGWLVGSLFGIIAYIAR